MALLNDIVEPRCVVKHGCTMAIEPAWLYTARRLLAVLNVGPKSKLCMMAKEINQLMIMMMMMIMMIMMIMMMVMMMMMIMMAAGCPPNIP